MGKSHAGFFEHGAFRQQPGASAAAFRAFPDILAKPLPAVLNLERGADSVLQAEEIAFDGGKVGRGRHGVVVKRERQRSRPTGERE